MAAPSISDLIKEIKVGELVLPEFPAGLHLDNRAGKKLRPLTLQKVSNRPFPHLEDVYTSEITRSVAAHGEFVFSVDPRRAAKANEYLYVV